MTTPPVIPDDAARPPLRERKRLATRRAILEAVAEIELIHGGAIDPSLITYARVAEIADVSERTVYRFFPTKADLDEAYLADQPILLGADVPDDPSIGAYADLIEEIGRRWDARTGRQRIDEHEIDSDDYPQFMAARREGDRAAVQQLRVVAGSDAGLSERQLLALTAAIHSTVSIRTLAITAQRWNLTIGETARAHAWTLRTLLDALASQPPEPWEDA